MNRFLPALVGRGSGIQPSAIAPDLPHEFAGEDSGDFGGEIEDLGDSDAGEQRQKAMDAQPAVVQRRADPAAAQPSAVAPAAGQVSAARERTPATLERSTEVVRHAEAEPRFIPVPIAPLPQPPLAESPSETHGARPEAVPSHSPAEAEPRDPPARVDLQIEPAPRPVPGPVVDVRPETNRAPVSVPVPSLVNARAPVEPPIPRGQTSAGVRAEGRAVEVRIGRIEVRSPQRPVQQPAPADAFQDVFAARNYLERFR